MKIIIFIFFCSFSLLAQDLIISSNVIYEDTTIVLNGNLIIEDNGSLTLNASTIQINCLFEGQYSVRVDTSGSLIMLNHSELSAADNSFNYAFVCQGREFKMQNSILSGAGWGVFDELQGYPDDGTKGPFITSAKTFIDSSEIKECYTGLLLASDSAVVSNSHIHSNVIGGIKIFSASYILIENNLIEDEEAMGLIEAKGGYGNQIINNQLISPYGEGATQCIRMGSSKNYLVDGNYMESGGTGVWLWDCDDNTIINNTIKSGETALIIWGWNNLIENNTLDSYLECYGDPIYMTFAYNTRVINNRIINLNNSNHSGIWLRHSSNNLFIGNTIDALPRDHFQNKTRGMLITESSSHNILHSNTIDGSSYGIFISYSSNHNKLYNNEISGTEFQGIVLDDADSNFIYSNNRMTNIGIAPFDDGENYWEYSGSEPVFAAVTEPIANDTYGKQIVGQEVIENQTINFHFADVTEGASLIIRNSTLIMGIHPSDMSYINLQPNSTLEIYDSKILHHEYGGGFTMDAGGGNSNFILNNCEIRGAGHEWWYGGTFIMTDNSNVENCTFYETSIIFQECNAGRFVGNRVYHSYTGILFNWNAGNITFTDNIVDGAIRCGINGDGQNLIIQNNQVSNIWGEGIQTVGFTNCLIENNIVSNIYGPFPGIELQGSGNTAIGNQISNSFFGILDKHDIGEIKNNQISQCNIGFLTESHDQNISNNNIAECTVGLYVDNSRNQLNSFEISNCDTGIFISGNAGENFIYGNDLIENVFQAINVDTSNHFDFEGAGNFWSDYYGVDEDSNGIGDTPYPIDYDVSDRYPLMLPTSFPVQPIFGFVEMEGMVHDQLSAGNINEVITKISIWKSPSDSSKVFEWIGLRFDRIGNGVDEDISSIKIWRDNNNNTSVENDVDSLLGSGSFNDAKAYIIFYSNEVITADSGDYLISFDLSENISNSSNSVGISFKDSSCFICKFPAKIRNSNFPFSTDEFLLTDIQPYELPILYSLSQNYPNPFNPSTTIEYQISNPSFVNIKVYDILGREVKELVNEEKQTGKYKIEFDGSNISSGVYFYKIQAGNFFDTKKLIVLK